MMTCVFGTRIGIRCAYLYVMCHLSWYISAWIFYAGVRCPYLDTRDMTYDISICTYMDINTCTYVSKYTFFCGRCAYVYFVGVRVFCTGFVYANMCWDVCWSPQVLFGVSHMNESFSRWRSVPLMSHVTHMNESLQHTTATHYCNTLLQHTTATHCFAGDSSVK